MRFIDHPQHRRGFLRLGMTFTGGVLLSACGGAGADQANGDAVVVVPGTGSIPGTPGATPGGTHAANLVLTLGYLGAQYYGHAARGSGLAPSATAGIGVAGAVTGARTAILADTLVARTAAELADDKAAHVAALRALLGPLAAAQPAIDLSPTGAFARAAQQAGLVAGGAAFDPYASDGSFLLGAFLIENAVAATYRTLLAGMEDGPAAALVSAHLGDAIYHGGVIRALIDDLAASDPAMARAMAAAAQALVALDGTAGGDQSPAGANGIAANLPDADGRPIPFTRDASQVLRTLYLSSGGAGGFLPAGANGLPA